MHRAKVFLQPLSAFIQSFEQLLIGNLRTRINFLSQVLAKSLFESIEGQSAFRIGVTTAVPMLDESFCCVGGFAFCGGMAPGFLQTSLPLFGVIDLWTERQIDDLLERDLMSAIEQVGHHFGSLMARHIARRIIDIRELGIPLRRQW